jgi:hypothetical protein
MGDLELHQQWARQLEKLGVENVRICLASNTYIPEIDREYAWEWLSERDKRQRAGDRPAIVAAVASVGSGHGLGRGWTIGSRGCSQPSYRFAVAPATPGQPLQ